MKFSKLIEEMRTIRDYKKDSIDPGFIEDIIQTAKNTAGIANGRQVSIYFIEQGRELVHKLSGKAGYYGKVIEAPHYLLIMTKEFPGFMENSGYIMETMRLKAWELGLGTCWLSIEDEKELKKIFQVESEERLTALAAIGYPYKGIFKADISPKSGRLGIEEIIYLNRWGNPCPIDVLETRGFSKIFYFAKFAPSWGNKQPWRFIMDQDKILLTVHKEEKRNVHLDAGIIMLYLEKAACEEGIKGYWQVNDSIHLKEAYGIPEDYEMIGYFSI